MTRQDRHEVGPDAFLAASLVETALGGGAAQVHHRPSRHFRFIYDVTLTDGRHAIVRIGTPEQRDLILNTASRADLLRPLGIPLPEIFTRDTISLFPSLVTERLPGATLGKSLQRLSRPVVGALAGAVADMQSTLLRLPGTDRFGHSDDAEIAPHESWTGALEDALAIDCAAIREVGIVPPHLPDAIMSRFSRVTPELDIMPARPFLPDITLRNLIVTDEGRLSGLAETIGLCWGDPRLATARMLMALMIADLPTGFAEAWLALSSHRRDGIFWLYTGIACIETMAEFGRTESGIATAISDRDHERLTRIVAFLLDRIDRLT